MYLNFPQMHPDLLDEARRASLPEGLVYLDPGLDRAPAATHLRPELPFDPRAARALLADTLRFGESLPNPRDILAQGLAAQANQGGGLAPESSRAVLAEVEQSMRGLGQASAAASDPLLEARRQAQMVLLLAWNLELRLIELQGIEAGLRTAWDRLGVSVSAGEGVVDDEADEAALAVGRELSGLGLPDPSAVPLPWRRLLEAFLLLAPGVVLCTTDQELAASLAEAGLPAGPAQSAPGATAAYQAPAWRLMGLDRLPEARPWLDASVTLAVYAAGA